MRPFPTAYITLASVALLTVYAGVVRDWQPLFLDRALQPYGGPEERFWKGAEYQMPKILVPINEANRHQAFYSGSVGRVYFSGSEGTHDEQRMLASFQIPYDKTSHHCYLAFFLKTSPVSEDRPEACVRGQGLIDVYRLKRDIFIGKTTFHGRPPRDPEEPVFSIDVPPHGGDASVSSRPVKCEPGETLSFELMAVRGAGMVDVSWIQEGKAKNGNYVESGVGIVV